MTQNNNSHNYGSRTQGREWNDRQGSNDRNNDMDNRDQDSDYDQDQHSAQGGSPRWNRTSGYQGDNYSNGRHNDYNQRSGNRYDGNYAGREYGSGNGYSSDNNYDRDEQYGSRRSYDNNDRGYQGRGYNEGLQNDRGYENASRNMYGNDYGQGQYGSQIGRSYNQDNRNQDNNRQGGRYGMDNSSYGRGTNYGMGTNYGSSSNFGSGNWGSGANNGAGNWNNDNNQGSGLHRGKGPKGYNRSDDRIKEDISDRLSDDAHVDASEIELEVSNGVVSLSGTVDSRETKRRAEDIAESISGVSNVENRLSVNKENGNTGNSTERKGTAAGTSSATSGNTANSDHDSKSKRTMTGTHN